ncbi:sterol desaturase family protein [Sphingomonas sp. MMS12-HWE2-04]|uniref:sterol desaturase family protein n=1 Tax=Sphingomonas sp. MMS12-HWE2-04 TaxID=3234199 RepID=UPI003851058C
MDAIVAHIWASFANQLGGTFLLPGSTFSFAALAVTLVLAVLLAVPRGRARPVRLRVLRRALFPRRMLRSASGRADLFYFFGGIVFAGLVIGWALWSGGQIRDAILARVPHPGLIAVPAWLGATIATAALFLAYEFAYWFDHWLMHRVPALWHFHKVHHQAESLSLLTNGRVHPIETIGFYNIVALVTGVTGVALVLLFGPAITPLALGGTNLLIFVAAVGLTHLQHSHFWIHFGPRWGRVLLGPAHHQIHHSADPAHFNRNLGSSLALFDRLFGTFHMPAPRREALRFGVDDGARNPHGVYSALAAPFVDSARALLPRSGAPVRPAPQR